MAAERTTKEMLEEEVCRDGFVMACRGSPTDLQRFDCPYMYIWLALGQRSHCLRLHVLPLVGQRKKLQLVELFKGEGNAAELIHLQKR